MTVTSFEKDPTTLTMTVTSEFHAPVERVWQMWADPRKLEQWWGPPTYPATVVDHDLAPGGRVSYFMTGSDGDRVRGWWQVLSVDPPLHLQFEDGFADDSGAPNRDMPTMTMSVVLSEAADGTTRMAITSTFPTLEAMEQILSMGAEEGMTAALSQIDNLLT